MAAQPLSANALFSDGNLVSYWKYDETSGTSAADSKGSNTGTATRSAILNNAGKFTNCALFAKASSDQVGYTDIFQLTAYTNMTFHFWFKTSSSGVDDTIIGNYDQTTGGGWSIDLRSDNKIHLDTWSTLGANTGDVATPSTVNDGNWHHIAVVKTSNTAILYLDGSAGTSGSITPISCPVGGKFVVGGESRIYGFSDSSVDDLAVFSRALNSTEITSLAVGGTAYTQTCNETVTIVATIANLTSKVANETITVVASMTRSMTRSLNEVVTIVASSSASLIITRSFNEIVAIVDSVASRISAKVFSEVITVSETLSKLVAYARSYSETVTVTVAVTIQKNLVRAYSETITIVASITNIKALGRVFNEVITITQRFQGLINGLDISWARKYSNQAGTWLGKYSSQAGTWIKKYFDIP
jgi:hypothetical protein